MSAVPAHPEPTVAERCRWCGAPGAKIVPAGHLDWTVECENCGARGPRHEAGSAALILWNARVPAPAVPPAETLEHRRTCGHWSPEAHTPGDCTCCLQERIDAQNWYEHYMAWMKRASEAEAEVERLRSVAPAAQQPRGPHQFSEEEVAQILEAAVGRLTLPDFLRAYMTQSIEDARARLLEGLLADFPPVPPLDTPRWEGAQPQEDTE